MRFKLKILFFNNYLSVIIWLYNVKNWRILKRYKMFLRKTKKCIPDYSYFFESTLKLCSNSCPRKTFRYLNLMKLSQLFFFFLMNICKRFNSAYATFSQNQNSHTMPEHLDFFLSCKYIFGTDWMILSLLFTLSHLGTYEIVKWKIFLIIFLLQAKNCQLAWNVHTVFPHIVFAETMLFWFWTL